MTSDIYINIGFLTLCKKKGKGNFCCVCSTLQEVYCVCMYSFNLSFSFDHCSNCSELNLITPLVKRKMHFEYFYLCEKLFISLILSSFFIYLHSRYRLINYKNIYNKEIIFLVKRQFIKCSYTPNKLRARSKNVSFLSRLIKHFQKKYSCMGYTEKIFNQTAKKK